MKSYRMGPKGNYVTIGTWHCKYDSGEDLCACCQPKNVISPQILKHPSSEIRDYFRQTDASGKSRTPKGSSRPHRHIELIARRERIIA